MLDGAVLFGDPSTSGPVFTTRPTVLQVCVYETPPDDHTSPEHRSHQTHTPEQLGGCNRVLRTDGTLGRLPGPGTILTAG